MEIFFQLLLNGIIAGSIYALIASGFSIIYSTNKFVHFAHGGVVALSAYVLYWLFSGLGLNFYISSLLTIAFAGFLGFIVYQFIYKPLKGKGASTSVLLIASIAILIFVESLNILLFGADIKTIKFLEIKQGLSIFGAIITPLQIFIIASSIILFFSLHFFMKKSKLGRAMRAVSGNKDVAEIVGIDSVKIFRWSFIIGSAIAGIAAVLVSLEQNIQPTMGTGLIIKGFTGAVIGGIGNVPGAILGSLILGLAENFGIWFLPSGYKDAIAFVLLFVFLLFRLQGILGTKFKKND